MILKYFQRTLPNNMRKCSQYKAEQKKIIIWHKWQIVIYKDTYKMMILKKKDCFLQCLCKYFLGRFLCFQNKTAWIHEELFVLSFILNVIQQNYVYNVLHTWSRKLEKIEKKKKAPVNFTYTLPNLCPQDSHPTVLSKNPPFCSQATVTLKQVFRFWH